MRTFSLSPPRKTSLLRDMNANAKKDDSCSALTGQSAQARKNGRRRAQNASRPIRLHKDNRRAYAGVALYFPCNIIGDIILKVYSEQMPAETYYYYIFSAASTLERKLHIFDFDIGETGIQSRPIFAKPITLRMTASTEIIAMRAIHRDTGRLF